MINIFKVYFVFIQYCKQKMYQHFRVARFSCSTVIKILISNIFYKMDMDVVYSRRKMSKDYKIANCTLLHMKIGRKILSNICLTINIIICLIHLFIYLLNV